MITALRWIGLSSALLLGWLLTLIAGHMMCDGSFSARAIGVVGAAMLAFAVIEIADLWRRA